jgi:dCTP deaminase
MILSNVEIHRALDERRLIIEPQPQPRIPGTEGGDCRYQTTAVDLTLGAEIAYLRDGLPLDVNLGRGGFALQLGAAEHFALSGDSHLPTDRRDS